MATNEPKELELDSILEKDPTGRAQTPDEEVMVFSVSGDDIKALSIDDLSILSQPKLSFVSLPNATKDQAREQLEIRTTSPSQQARDLAAELKASAEEVSLSLNVAGKYKLIKKLAEGGEGVVFLARHMGLHLNPMRVIKFLPPQKIGEGDALKRFAQEIELTASLSQRSDHIVRIYDDFGIAPELGCFYVMEYLDGCTLRDFIHKYRGLPLHVAVHIFKQLCSGVQAIHQAGILHQDLKPKNIFLIRREDNIHFVKVGDFGIARMPYNPTTHMPGNEGAGTPAYMAPEQLMGTKTDFRTDIYALGLILFELITGRKPFLPRGKTMEEARDRLAQAHLHQHPPLMQLHQQDYKIPIELEELVQKALEKSRADRPKNVRALLAVLENVEQSLRTSSGSILSLEAPLALEEEARTHSRRDAAAPPVASPRQPIHEGLEETPTSTNGQMIVLDKVKSIQAGQPESSSQLVDVGLLPADHHLSKGFHPPEEKPQTPPRATAAVAPQSLDTPQQHREPQLDLPTRSMASPPSTPAASAPLARQPAATPLSRMTPPSTPMPHTLSGVGPPQLGTRPKSQQPIAQVLPMLWIALVFCVVGGMVLWVWLIQKPQASAHGHADPHQTTTKRQVPRFSQLAPLQPAVPSRPAVQPRTRATVPRVTRRAPIQRRTRTRRPLQRRRAQPRPVVIQLTKGPTRPRSLPGCPPTPSKGRWIRFRLLPKGARIQTNHRRAEWSGGFCLLRRHPGQRLRLRLTHIRHQPCLLDRTFKVKTYKLKLQADQHSDGLDDRLDACLR